MPAEVEAQVVGAVADPLGAGTGGCRAAAGKLGGIPGTVWWRPASGAPDGRRFEHHVVRLQRVAIGRIQYRVYVVFHHHLRRLSGTGDLLPRLSRAIGHAATPHTPDLRRR
jgi:hypothetical protein